MAKNSEIFHVFEAEDKVAPYQMHAFTAESKLSWLDHTLLHSRPFEFVKTSIIATIGPSSNNRSTIEEMISAGMRVVRISCQSGNAEVLKETVLEIQEAASNYSKKVKVYCPLAIVMDIVGPTIRTGYIENDGKEYIVKSGNTFKLTTDRAFTDHGTDQQIFVDYENIQKLVKVGSIIFINDALIKLEVKSIQGNVITTTVIIGNKLVSQALLNFPGTNIDVPFLTDKDKADILLAAELKVDAVIVSFVRSHTCILYVKKMLREIGSDMLVIAKIQNQQGLENFDDILDVADGIGLWLNILSIEINSEKFHQSQKYVILKSNMEGKPCFLFSKYLGNMINSVLPSVPEANDLANAANQGATAIILSSPTSEGKFPVDCVRIASNICREGETCIWQRNLFDEMLQQYSPSDDFYVTAVAAARLAFMADAKAIIVVTTSGKTAFTLTQFMPRGIILAITRCEKVARSCSLRRGIIPLLYRCPKLASFRQDVRARLEAGECYLKSLNLLKTGDPIVTISPSKNGSPNVVKVIYATVIPEKVYPVDSI